MTRDRVIGAASVAALCATVAGANLPNPLQPNTLSGSISRHCCRGRCSACTWRRSFCH